MAPPNTTSPARPSLDAEEKQLPVHVEYNERRQSAYGDDGKADSTEAVDIQKDIDEGFDPLIVKRLTRKIDRRLIPVLSMMYAISLIDRTNLAIARAANDVYMDQDASLGTKYGQRYSIITLVFFVPYIVLELPSQVGLRKFGAKWWLSSAVMLWGIVMLCMGFAKTWTQLAGMRALLGAFESALFPGAAYLISCWYPRNQMAQRNVVFYITSAVAGSFAKPLGYCFSLLHMKGGLAGWQWMFVIYGIMTIVIAIIAFLFIVDFVDKAKFLTEEERHITQTRIQRDRGDAKPDPMTFKKVLTYSAELKPWLFAFFFMSTTLATYSFAYFLPTILASMGFNNVESMLLGTPAYFYALIPALATGRIADKIRNARAAVIMFNAVCIVIGVAMFSQLEKDQKAARFVGIFLAVGGGNSNVPLIVSWSHTAIRAQSKRAFTSAIVVAFGGIGGILASCVFMQTEAKKGYPTGIFITMGCNAGTAVIAGLLSLWFKHRNRLADQGKVVIEGHDDFRYQC